MGTLIRVTGPNTSGTPTNCAAASYSIPATEESTCAQYDVFGRMVALVKPGDSTSYPTVQAYYDDAEQPFRYRVQQREQAGTGNVRVQPELLRRPGPADADQAGRAGRLAEHRGRYALRWAGPRDRAIAAALQQRERDHLLCSTPTPAQLFNRDHAPATTRLSRPLDVTAPDSTTMTHQYGLDQDSGGALLRIYDANNHLTA